MRRSAGLDCSGFLVTAVCPGISRWTVKRTGRQTVDLPAPESNQAALTWSTTKGALERCVLRPEVEHERVRAVYGLDRAATLYFSSPPFSLFQPSIFHSFSNRVNHIFPRVKQVDLSG
jgi:hypothetical protein